MSCNAWQELLQQHLDGVGSTGALEQHLRACPDCAAHRGVVRRFCQALGQLSPVPPPADLADRITSALLEHAPSQAPRARIRLWSLVALAAAAAILVVVGLWPRKPTGELPGEIEPGPIVKTPDQPDEPKVEPLHDSVARAGAAMANLTSRTAGATVETTAQLLPRVDVSTMTGPLMNDGPMDPPLEPLLEAGEGVSSGLAPVADSAKRAFSLFMRDLPVAGSANDKPG